MMRGAAHDDAESASVVSRMMRTSLGCRWAVFGVVVLLLLAVGVPVVVLMVPADSGGLPCHLDLSVPLVNATFHAGGAVSSSGILYPEGHHFSVNGTLRGCICSLKPCIRKCCERNEHYVARRTCGVNTDVDMSNFSLTVYTEHGVVVEVPVTEFAVLYGTVCYDGMFPLDPSSPQDRHYLLEDGRVLRFKSEHEEVYLDATRYCLDSIKGSSVVRTFVCVAPIEDRDTKISFAIYPIMLSISTLFLLLTFLVYCAIPKLRNSQGKCQMCYISFLFVAYAGLTVSNLKVAVGVWCVACGSEGSGRMARKLGAGSVDQKRQRELNRIYKISGCVVVVIVVMIAVPVYYHMRDTPPVTYPCHIDLSVPLLSPQFYSNGSVVDHGDVYPTGFYFTVNGTTRGCLCALNPCIRKCCAKDEYMVKVPMRQARCEKNPEPSPFDNFTLPVYQSPGNFADVAQDHFRILYGDVCRHDKFMLMPETQPQDQYDLMVDGRIHLENNYIDASGYCLESLNGSEEIRTLVCFPDQDEDPETKAMFTVYPIGMIISIPFMVVTFLVYSVLPELRNLHGISLMCHSAVLLTAYLFLSIIQISRNALNTTLCTSFAFVVQFSFLASFFWLNVMCFDIWLVFSNMKPVQGRQQRKFLYYSLYAWGVPMFIVGVSIAMDMIPGVPDTWIKPRFGEQKCWFADNNGTLLYFYLPIAVVVVTNLVMFVSTAIRLRAHTKTTKVLHSSESRRTNESDRDRFHLYLKLFIIMGINWVMELVSFFVGGPKSVWFVTDLGNTLQGVLIFIIFVCKRRILRLLNEKLCPKWQIIRDTSMVGRSKVSPSRTNSTTVSKTTSDLQDSVALKPIARGNQGESDE
ncbi:probable G-protein coupled receptor Mth-like 4 [Macrosteles quadrilineatus]|uniref:probable G-protein coupled receptor Mth-like 4 n=1 Tax=Macrosteles quadrilineatus TaxID=74068 RepID=UPI0023E29169|nr:probable G-protein coupled receptor Mth-like 4 [Macrosteles quadrilineatus]